MEPESRCGGSLLVAVFVEAFGEEVVGELVSLGKAIDTFVNLEVYPAITGFVVEVVFLEKFTGDIGKADTHIVIAVERVFK